MEETVVLLLSNYSIYLRSTNDAVSESKNIASNVCDWRVLTHQGLPRHLPGRKISKASVKRDISGPRLEPGALLLFNALLMIEFTVSIEVSALLLQLLFLYTQSGAEVQCQGPSVTKH